MNASENPEPAASDFRDAAPVPDAEHGAPATDAEATSGHRAGGRSRSRMPLWLDTLVTMGVALVIAVLVKTFLIQPFYIPSASMNPTLLEDDKIMVSKLTPGVFDLHRGDVIVFQDPADWIPGDATEDPTPRVRLMMALSLVGLAPDPSQDHLVKRLIGLPGDHVVCSARDAVLEVNGVPVDEPYINPETSACQGAFDVTVPEGHVWVMGDNRHASADSAYHEINGESGFVPLDDVTGRAEVIFWPASRWDGLGGGRDAFADVPDQP
ncbi:signal peptidase I [Brachybacterium sp. J153]|uniref:signal peptidase I n=1 Tax=Brachybacterium sp. J153 TaxID=3116488 RepID=UPI002E7731D0|nr:signal peptidase I [Brachybacterium sp. J153]MEE1618873.1 signal peptidase I [Brachybacterium sp. J153]